MLLIEAILPGFLLLINIVGTNFHLNILVQSLFHDISFMAYGSSKLIPIGFINFIFWTCVFSLMISLYKSPEFIVLTLTTCYGLIGLFIDGSNVLTNHFSCRIFCFWSELLTIPVTHGMHTSQCLSAIISVCLWNAFLHAQGQCVYCSSWSANQ